MSKNKTKTIVTVGNGVAAWTLHFYLRNTGLNVTNISSNDFFTPCSKNSTAINCLRGTTPGNSPLGDTIIASMEEFEKFNHEFKPDGVTEGIEFQILEDATIEKWERRYPKFLPIENNKFLKTLINKKTLYHEVPAYFIDVTKFETWLKNNSFVNNSINDLVINIEKRIDKYIVFTRNQEVEADIVILCTGHLTHLLGNNIGEDFKYYIDHSKQVTGGYLELNSASTLGFSFDKSFVLAIEQYHFIYRKNQDCIQIGSSSKNKDALELPLDKMLREIYEHIDTHTQFELPEYSKFEAKTGIRHKGYLRRPYWGPVDNQNFMAICGLYKNAFSFSFKAAKDLVSLIESQ